MIEKHLLPVEEYQEPIDFATQQLSVFWLPDEIKVEKDIHDVLTNFTEAEKHGVITTLKLFSLYETHAGDEYWGGRFKKMFDGAEFHRMASVFSMFELAVHAPFYNKINQLLHVDTPEFYLSYLDNETLKARIEHIGEIIGHPDDAVSLAMFSFVEGVVLYSSFAFLKSFQANGRNKLANVVRGLDFSVRDENFHCIGGAWCYHLKTKDYTKEQKEAVEKIVVEGAKTIYEHEEQIVEMVFENGEIEGISKTQMKIFIKSRINEVLHMLGMKPLYKVSEKENVVSSWFYKSINNYQFVDFFSGTGREYHRQWDERGFVWKTPDPEANK